MGIEFASGSIDKRFKYLNIKVIVYNQFYKFGVSAIDLNIFEKDITSKFNTINERYNSLLKDLVNLNSKNESLNTQIKEPLANSIPTK